VGGGQRDGKGEKEREEERYGGAKCCVWGAGGELANASEGLDCGVRWRVGRSGQRQEMANTASFPISPTKKIC
jgi:hypothetical protein